MHTLRHFVLFRTLQVLGAYGFRGFFEKKPHFIESVPFALANLSELLKDDFKSYPYLCEVLHRVIQKMSRPALPAEEKKLTVTVMSFSYRKGIPEDESGNGGGYVFDCRAIRNPGRYEPYKQLTGRDEPVIRFLGRQRRDIPLSGAYRCAGGCTCGTVSETRIYSSVGLLRMYGRPAPLCLFCPAYCRTFAPQSRQGASDSS